MKAGKTFHVAGIDITVRVAYEEKPAFKIVSADICPGVVRYSKTGNTKVKRLFGTLESWFEGGTDLLPLEDLDLQKLSVFERKILCELRKSVPRGKTVSYGGLAKLAGFPGAARAVGTVMGKNPFPLFFPCHRVIRSDGSTGFFQGGPAGAKLKEALLEVEKMNIQ
jgi:methylated-DNA-[protein]-cysteine S-methyltransferase